METSNCNLDVVFALAGNENEVKTFLLVTNLQRSKSRGFFGEKANYGKYGRGSIKNLHFPKLILEKIKFSIPIVDSTLWYFSIIRLMCFHKLFNQSAIRKDSRCRCGFPCCINLRRKYRCNIPSRGSS